MGDFRTLVVTREFLRSLPDLSAADQRRVVRALDLLDEDERHPSLRVHQLTGGMAGLWSAAASRSLRITFRRLPSGHNGLVKARQHYGD